MHTYLGVDVCVRLVSCFNVIFWGNLATTSWALEFRHCWRPPTISAWQSKGREKFQARMMSGRSASCRSWACKTESTFLVGRPVNVGVCVCVIPSPSSQTQTTPRVRSSDFGKMKTTRYDTSFLKQAEKHGQEVPEAKYDIKDSNVRQICLTLVYRGWRMGQCVVMWW